MNRDLGRSSLWIWPVVSLIFAVAHILVVSGRDRVTFHPTTPLQPYMIGILVLFFFFTWSFYLALLRCVMKLLRKEQEFFYRFRFFAGYFFFMSLFWVLTWPGIFKGDEFYVIRAALSFELSAMQSGLTSVFYIIALLFFPSMATIVFFQLVVICGVFAYVVGNLWERFSTKARYVLLFPFALFPVIDANLFTLRASLVGWLFLLLLCYLWKMKDEPGDIIKISVVAGLICAWRSEFIYLIVCLPLLLMIRKKVSLRGVLFVFLGVCIFWQGFSIPNKIAANGQNKYPISLVLNPVANLFTEVEELKGPDVHGDVMAINEVVDAAQLRKDASVRNISQYWNIPDVLPKETLSGFMKAAIRLIVYNPGKFLKYRWQTFLYTNSFYDGYTNHPGGEDLDAIGKLTYYGMDYGNYFLLSRPFLGYDLRMKVISLLACRTYEKGNIHGNALLVILYNVLPVVLLSVIMLIVFAMKKKWERFWLLLLALVQFPLVFLTAPAMFFMYYYCFYLCGWVFLAYTLSSWMEKRHNADKNGGNTN
ncbi:MAG: hypothetical protein IK078_06110 [Lachnospiraceae bacterium]|nr:hypothetical protein [Lachnospiraceae bacterium]